MGAGVCGCRTRCTHHVSHPKPQHGFIEHNRDRLPDHLRLLMQTSHHPLMRELYPSAGTGGAEHAHPVLKQQPKQHTIVSGFRRQLTSLAKTLASTTPHYMKCIKPNQLQMRPVDGLVAFDERKVYQQLLYSGVMELCDIRNRGFMFREPYADFWRRCVRQGIADLTNLPEDMDPRNGTLAVCNAALPAFDERSHPGVSRHVVGDERRGGAFWVAGHTMLLGKAGTLRHLREYKVGKLSARVRAWWRQRIVVLQTSAFAQAVTRVQVRWRGIHLRRRAAEIAGDVLVLQRLARAALAITHMRERRQRVQSAEIVGRHWRTRHGRTVLAAISRRLLRFHEVSSAAETIQRAARHQRARWVPVCGCLHSILSVCAFLRVGSVLGFVSTLS